MPQAVTIGSLPRAFEFVKAMQGEGLEWGEGYRGLGRDAIAAILQGQMAQAVDEHLDRMALRDEAGCGTSITLSRALPIFHQCCPQS